MLSRRELMRNGLLLSSVGAMAPGLATSRRMPADVWILDEQLPAAAEVIAAAHRGSAEQLSFRADPGPVWMHVLEPRLKEGPFAIGGYTNASVLFCLHYLARDYGLALAGLGEDIDPHAPLERRPDTLVDLRDPRFVDQRTAYTWLMLPRRV